MTRLMSLMRLWVGGALVISCGGSADDVGQVGDPCIEGRCADGLYCAPPSVIDMAGRCTADCQDQTFCAAHFGPQASCFSRTYCAKKCTSPSDCQGGYCTAQSNGDRLCLSN